MQMTAVSRSPLIDHLNIGSKKKVSEAKEQASKETPKK